jgi:hypothetical protein
MNRALAGQCHRQPGNRAGAFVSEELVERIHQHHHTACGGHAVKRLRKKFLQVFGLNVFRHVWRFSQSRAEFTNPTAEHPFSQPGVGRDAGSVSEEENFRTFGNFMVQPGERGALARAAATGKDQFIGRALSRGRIGQFQRLLDQRLTPDKAGLGPFHLFFDGEAFLFFPCRFGLRGERLKDLVSSSSSFQSSASTARRDPVRRDPWRGHHGK